MATNSPLNVNQENSKIKGTCWQVDSKFRFYETEQHKNYHFEFAFSTSKTEQPALLISSKSISFI